MLAPSILVVVLATLVQGQEDFSGPDANAAKYGEGVIVTKTGTFSFTSATTRDSFVTETSIVYKTFNVLSTLYSQITQTVPITSTVTLTDLTQEPAVTIETVTGTTVIPVTNTLGVGIIVTETSTRHRTLMHMEAHLVKETKTRTTTVTEKYQVVQMQTAVQTVTVTHPVDIIVTNTVFLPAVVPAPVTRNLPFTFDPVVPVVPISPQNY
ncbi:unnamed protein product [Meganyctiphanes norvegica]|uniref:Uncharacterized protein n=1 Tax=Meganyctiphanes norvegica TaxID=48144 RepID=A0AAV2R9G7_MEGNR